jgi:hypothetical protein
MFIWIILDKRSPVNLNGTPKNTTGKDRNQIYFTRPVWQVIVYLFLIRQLM